MVGEELTGAVEERGIDERGQGQLFRACAADRPTAAPPARPRGSVVAAKRLEGVGPRGFVENYQSSRLDVLAADQARSG